MRVGQKRSLEPGGGEALGVGVVLGAAKGGGGGGGGGQGPHDVGGLDAKAVDCGGVSIVEDLVNVVDLSSGDELGGGEGLKHGTGLGGMGGF